MPIRHVLAFATLAALVALVGCRSVPAALMVEGDLPGTYWEITSFDGPVELLGAAPRTSELEKMSVVVQMVELHRRGWGEILPWAWFGAERAFHYYVGWESKRDSGWRMVTFWTRPSGVLSDFELATALLVESNGDADDDWRGPSCSLARMQDAARCIRERA